jgi:hypothetical protein
VLAPGKNFKLKGPLGRRPFPVPVEGFVARTFPNLRLQYLLRRAVPPVPGRLLIESVVSYTPAPPFRHYPMHENKNKHGFSVGNGTAGVNGMWTKTRAAIGGAA